MNFLSWYKDRDLQSYDTSFSKIFHQFSQFMENKAEKVINMTHKYKSEYYFKFFMITQTRRIPFTIYINFNYIEYLNQCGFNYIIYLSEYEDLKPFVRDIIDEYMTLLDEFLSLFKDKWDDMDVFNTKYDRKLIKYFNELIIQEYKDTNQIALSQLSVTCDIHFNDSASKSIFFNAMSNIKKEHYKVMTVDDETIFFYPFNRNLQKLKKTIPKIRFYDKQKDTIFRYHKKRHAGQHYFLLKNYDDVSQMERFEAIDIYSQDSKKLEKEFIEAFSFLHNTLRFELEWNKHAIKEEFGSRDFFTLDIDNQAIMERYLAFLIDMETVSYKDLIYHDSVTNYKKIIHYVRAKVSPLETTGDLTERFNFVVKNAHFLNRMAFETSNNSVYSKVKRLRKKGVLSGYGKNVHLNEPYRSLLDLYNHYFVTDYINTHLVRQNDPLPKAGGGCRLVR